MAIERSSEFVICTNLVNSALIKAGSMNYDPEAMMNALALHMVIAESTLKLPKTKETTLLFEPLAEKCRKFLQEEIRKIKSESN